MWPLQTHERRKEEMMNAIMLTLALLSGGAELADTGEVPATLLYVRTTPSGADVRLDGERLGISDDLFPVKPGAHEIAVDLEGYRPHHEVSADNARRFTSERVIVD